ncbi:hypothetical protein F4604DRAFT_1677458 [Suillus subluteus]|nr:hypothetical protein F4604DRAFT_1677458 [Suillus subluteus]
MQTFSCILLEKACNTKLYCRQDGHIRDHKHPETNKIRKERPPSIRIGSDDSSLHIHSKQNSRGLVLHRQCKYQQNCRPIPNWDPANVPGGFHLEEEEGLQHPDYVSAAQWMREEEEESESEAEAELRLWLCYIYHAKNSSNSILSTTVLQYHDCITMMFSSARNEMVRDQKYIAYLLLASFAPALCPFSFASG